MAPEFLTRRTQMAISYRLRFEDHDLLAMEGWDEVIDAKEDALAAFEYVVLDPDLEIGSVYVTEVDGDEERVIAAHAFVDESTGDPTMTAIENEGYNGWTNRETWAVMLWIDLDAVADMVADRLTVDESQWTLNLPFPRRIKAADVVKDYVVTLLDPDEGLMNDRDRWLMATDVGSLWRVNWEEIAEHCLELLDEAGKPSHI